MILMLSQHPPSTRNVHSFVAVWLPMNFVFFEATHHYDGYNLQIFHVVGRCQKCHPGSPDFLGTFKGGSGSQVPVAGSKRSTELSAVVAAPRPPKTHTEPPAWTAAAPQRGTCTRPSRLSRLQNAAGGGVGSRSGMTAKLWRGI